VKSAIFALFSKGYFGLRPESRRDELRTPFENQRDDRPACSPACACDMRVRVKGRRWHTGDAACCALWHGDIMTAHHLWFAGVRVCMSVGIARHYHGTRQCARVCMPADGNATTTALRL
jgi:hypothetical protein